jgi:hypothetical protein
MAPPPIDLEDLPAWVDRQLQDLHALLKDNPEKVKAEFRRLNLHLRLIPVDYESDSAFYRIEGQCDLSALALSTWAMPDRSQGALLGRLRERAVQKRTLIWVFRCEIPGNGKVGRWRERRARGSPTAACK